ncbi:CHAP domain-containing protein [Burkholderiaceae bacterium UC74_6]
MENLIIDVVIGLLLIYIAASFLLMKVQESLDGGILRGRVSILLQAVNEAVGNDQDLKKLVLKNRLIASLWSGEVEPRSSNLFLLRRAKGPSQIPGDLFAKALLMALNPSRNLPSTEGRAPLPFIDELMKAAPKDSDRMQYLQALRGLVPSNTSGWPEFELAIATWFTDICDRSDGWLKRRSEAMGLILAFLLCAAINVDTVHIVNVFGSDPELREGFGALGELVAQQNRGAAAGASAPKPATPDPALDPRARAIGRLDDALFRLHEAYNKDRAIAGYGVDEIDTKRTCPLGSAEEVPAADRAASAAAGSKAGKDPKVEHMSNSDVWILVLTRIQAPLKAAIERVDESKANDAVLREVYGCINQVKAWVGSAVTASNRADTRNLMLEAAKALEDSSSSILAVIRNAESFGGLRNLFIVDPTAFARCADMGLRDLRAMSACVFKEQTLMSRLPIGHSASNWRQQFCEYKSPPKKASEAEVQAFLDSGPKSGPCHVDPLPPQPQLGLPALRLENNGWGWVQAFFGLVISALFISLGAPALFGLLNKFVDLRSAGRVRDASLSAVRGAGTLPLPMLAMPQILSDTAPAATGTTPAKVSTLPTVEGAQPGFEENLTDREMQALKQRLGVQPSTGGIDAATRAALLKETGSGQLTLASFTQLMGRPPVQAGPSVGALPSVLPQLRQPTRLARTLADNLNTKTNFPNRADLNTVTTFTDEMRAMAVLYRYGKAGNLTHTAAIFQTALNQPDQLDQLDEALLNDILSSNNTPVFQRHATAPWLDIALGELGQVESKGSTRATSNPRVCDYLDAVTPPMGNQGDNTPWCAAFVTWVLSHSRATNGALTTTSTNAAFASNANGLLVPFKDQAAAKSWIGWQRPDLNGAACAPVATGGTPPPQVGDVVVIAPSPGQHHTGFVYEVSTATNEFWLLAGNQSGASRVSLWRLPLKAIL